MEKIDTLVSMGRNGGSVRVHVHDGVNYLIKCPYDIKKLTIEATPSNPETVIWIAKVSEDMYLNFYFEDVQVFNTIEPVCDVVLMDKETFGGSEEEMEDYDSLEFLDELLLYVENETGVHLQYDDFGTLQ